MTIAAPPVIAPSSWRVAAGSGVPAGAAALVAGEAVGRALPGGVGPVVAIGNRVVALAPAQARDTGVTTFGTLDKPLLLIAS